MKRLVGIGLCWLVMISVVAGEEYREFTDQQGRTIRGCIVKFDGTKQMVTVESEDRRITQVPITIFSDADQEYILKWSAQEGIRSESKFRISCKRKNVKNWREKIIGPINYSDGSRVENQEVGRLVFDEIGYHIMLENKNSFPLSNLLLEYCIYYEQDVGKRVKQKIQQGVCHGSIKIDDLAPRGRREISTDPVRVYTRETNTEFTNSQEHKGAIHGVSLKLYLLEDEQKTLIRELSDPDTISDRYVWATESDPAGDNV